ncbi:unnamed protein product [Cyclocybe aegerita]|uniref:Uncharacterized protein n=1 Tax=Cyclocybe aegerita TaxID=1973307 RepID=A0A8S0WWG9_CYCAE|nr:unnamed protein product [Cyclocybe aegerita]
MMRAAFDIYEHPELSNSERPVVLRGVDVLRIVLGIWLVFVFAFVSLSLLFCLLAPSPSIPFHDGDDDGVGLFKPCPAEYSPAIGPPWLPIALHSSLFIRSHADFHLYQPLTPQPAVPRTSSTSPSIPYHSLNQLDNLGDLVYAPADASEV